ncbi:hypothetical protein I3843_12G003900 [Carya illinoinensis]|nr:hypothetical protein I3843_12G003900 [Carya illinoinensis]
MKKELKHKWIAGFSVLGELHQSVSKLFIVFFFISVCSSDFDLQPSRLHLVDQDDDVDIQL